MKHVHYQSWLSNVPKEVLKDTVQGMIITGSDDKIVYVNKAMASMLGKSESHIHGNKLIRLIDSSSQQELEKQRHYLLKGKIMSLQLAFPRVNNTALETVITAVPVLKNGEFDGIVYIVNSWTNIDALNQQLFQKQILLKEISLAFQTLVTENDTDAAINSILETIGRVLKVDRTYIFRNYSDERGVIKGIDQVYEWCTDGVDPQIDNPELQGVEYDPHFMAWYETLSQNRAYGGRVRDLKTEQEREILEYQGIKSLLVLPIFVDQTYWGFVGFDDVQHERYWEEDEQSVLMALAASIGTFLERQLKKEEIEEQRSFYETILNSLPSDIVVFNPDHTYRFVNPIAIKDPELREWIIGKNDYDYCDLKNKPYSLAESRRKVFNQLIAEKKEQRFEEKLIRPDGSEEWNLRIMKPMYDAQEKPTMVIGYGLNITKRKKAELDLKHKTEMLQHAQLIARLGSWEFDIQNETVHFSDQALSMFKFDGENRSYTIEELLELIHVEDAGIFKSELQRCISQKASISLDIRIRMHSESIFYVNIRAEYTDTPEGGKVVGTLLDITDVKKGELEVQSLAKFPEQNPLPVLRVSRNGTWLYHNKGSAQVKEYLESQFQHKYKHLYHSILDEDRVLDKEVSIGDTFYSLTFTPIPEFDYINIYGKDITSRVEQERELIRAREQALESQRLKQKFLANMSHEIRTPMNGVVGLINLLGQTQLQDSQARYLKLLKESSSHMMRLIDDILDVSRLEEGKLNLVEVSFDLKEVFEGVLIEMRRRAKEKNLAFTVEGLSVLKERYLGDPVRIRQVLLNLVSNAIKFTHAGFVSISISSNDLSEDTQSLEIVIQDSGIGIEEEALVSIFDPFSQGKHDTNHQYGGTGLGLNIVQELVHKMRGTISVESTPQEGSTFTVSIELKLASTTVSSYMETYSEGPLLEGVRTLLVDDYPMNLTIARTMLERWGATVIEAVNGQEALHQLSMNEFDIVLMDIQMPVMDGVQATEEIRNRPSSYQNIPIIAITAAALPEERERCLNAGMNDYLIKPFSPNALLGLIQKHAFSTHPIENVREAPIKSEPEESSKKPLVDLSYLRELADGNEAFVKEMVQTMLDDLPEHFRSIERALASNDYSTIKSVSHKAKSTAGYVGASTLKECFAQIEYKASDHLTSPISTLLDRAHTEFSDVKQYLITELSL